MQTCELEKKSLTLSPLCPDGGIGRRDGLKHRWSNPCRFDPGSGYKAVEKSNLLHVFFAGYSFASVCAKSVFEFNTK